MSSAGKRTWTSEIWVWPQQSSWRWAGWWICSVGEAVAPWWGHSRRTGSRRTLQSGLYLQDGHTQDKMWDWWPPETFQCWGLSRVSSPTWRVDQSNVVSFLQTSSLHQQSCHSLCPFMQLQAGEGAGHRSLEQETRQIFKPQEEM